MKKLYILASLPLLLAACSSNGKTEATPSPGAQTSPAANQQTQPTMAGVTVNLAEQNNSGQSGTATMTEENGRWKVMLNLTGGNITQPQPAHIHVGSCPTPGAVKYPLTNVVNGQSATMLPAEVTMEALKAAGPLAVNIHKSAAESSVYTACGDIRLDAAL